MIGSRLTEHKRLYRKLLTRLNLLLPKSDPELARYSARYQRDLSGNWRVSTESQLLSQVARSRVALVGDFHADPQGVRTLFRIARESKRPLTIALEAFGSETQVFLNRFQSGKLTLEQLRKKTHFDETWGYAWRPYAELLEYCRTRKISVRAIDLPRAHNPTQVPRGKTLLNRRDRWMAGHLADLSTDKAAERENRLVTALVGELHLARDHLPSAIALLGGSSVTRIHPAPHRLFWRSPKTRVFRRSKTDFAISMTPPWVRLQAQLQWLDGMSEDDPAEDDSEQMWEIDSALSELAPIQSLLERANPDVSALKVEFDEALEYPMLEIKQGKIVSGPLHFNARSEIAAHLLYLERRPETRLADQRLRRMTFAAWVSLLHNPRRKFDRTADLKRAGSMAAKKTLSLVDAKKPLAGLGSKRSARMASQLMATAILERAPLRRLSLIACAEKIESSSWRELCIEFRPLSLKGRKPRAL